MYEVDREAEIIKYLPLVERVVQRMSIKTTDYEQGDLFNIGVIGLMDALNKFDPTKKCLLKVMRSFVSKERSLTKYASMQKSHVIKWRQLTNFIKHDKS